MHAQGIIDSAAVASFFQECLALRLTPLGAAGRAARRSVAAGGMMQDAAQQPRKPPLPASGPPPPSLAASVRPNLLIFCRVAELHAMHCFWNT